LDGLDYQGNSIIPGFCLDIGKLETIASTLRDGIPCQIRRPRQFENATFFLLTADYIDGVHFYIIIPHPDSLILAEKQCRLKYDGYAKLANRIGPLPKIIRWSLSADNDAGVAHFFIDKFSGMDLVNCLIVRLCGLATCRLALLHKSSHSGS
jgi:hypothetical protein